MSPVTNGSRSSFEDEESVDDPDRVPTVETVLVPVDGSEDSTRAAEYAVAIADRYDATLEVLYILGEDVVRAIDARLYPTVVDGHNCKHEPTERTNSYWLLSEGPTRSPTPLSVFATEVDR